MSDAQDRKAALADAKNAVDTALTGFKRLHAILTAVRRLAEGRDVGIVDIAIVGEDVATEFANEMRSISDEYARLIKNAEGKN